MITPLSISPAWISLTPSEGISGLDQVWQACWQLPMPAPCEVWLSRLSPMTTLASKFEAFLDVTEIAELARLRQPADRIRMVLRRGLRRLLLARKLQCAPEHLRFAHHPGGKPILCEPSHRTLHFNTASAGDWFLLGMSPEQELGVDMEVASRLILTPELIDLSCSLSERQQLTSLSDADRAMAFLRLWTAKEAVLKLRGTGFHNAVDVRKVLETLSADECVTELPSVPEVMIHIATAGQGSVKAARKPKL